VQVSSDWSLIVDPLGKEVIGATLPFYYWEDYDPKFHQDFEDYQRQRQAYDDEFEASARFARRLLPSPIQVCAGMDKNAHKAVVWEGEHGLLILQQACFDPQFGIDLDFWLAGCSVQAFHPTTPLISWLCTRSQRLHADRGFPPLCW
jgi:hypothetical protein